MSRRYPMLRHRLQREPKRWLVTGVAGFIGSNLLEALLQLGQGVVGLDDFSTGHCHNLADVRRVVGEAAWANFSFVQGDIQDLETCAKVVDGVDYVLHQAALGSVPRSLADPITTNRVNIDGFLNMLVASRDAGVERFVYAASSSTYGDHPGLPKVEAEIGRPLSPYAVTKYVNELYAEVFASAYDTPSIGLRYFNVFGPRQDPEGAYAAVIPKWIGRLLNEQSCTIYGDGETSRDFCFIDNVVQANLLAATTTEAKAVNEVYNVAYGARTSLNELYEIIRDGLAQLTPTRELSALEPRYEPFRSGDVRHSQAATEKAQILLGYAPAYSLEQGLQKTLVWFYEQHKL